MVDDNINNPIKNIKVSVVIPIYNVVDKIDTCINCLINQSLKEIEIICVDDCSTDGTFDKIINFVEKFPNIKYIHHTENLSASISRKDGAMSAIGEYILFIDPDDTIEKNTLEIVYNTAKEKNVEIVHFGTNVINNGVTNQQVEWYKKFAAPYIGYIYDEQVFTKCFITQEYRFNIWNKLIKSNLCKKAMSQCVEVPLPKAQDLYAYFLIAYYARSYYGIENKLYNYNFGTGISGGRIFDKNKFIRHCSQSDVAYYIVQFLIQKSTLQKYYNAAFKIINNLINDNLASLKLCGKAKVDFGAENIFVNSWIQGEFQENLIKYINEKKDPFCAKLLFDINFKILKNISVRSRKAIFDRFNQIFVNYLYLVYDYEKTLDIQSKDYAFVQSIIAEQKYKKYGNAYMPIFLAANDNYMPYLGVTINSLIINADKSYVYDIFVMHSGINNYYINKIVKLCNDYIRIHCININDLIKSQKLYSNRHYSVEMYYRFLIPELFFFMKKVLYLDCDLIVLDSIHNLFMIEMDGFTLCAARNILHNEMYDYVINTLNADPNTYFNSGVILINCDLFITKNIKSKCYTFLSNNTNLTCPDQDALNMCCSNIKLLDLKWNFQWHHLLNEGKQNRYKIVDNDIKIYNEAQNDIKILHFTSNKKPWNYLKSEYSDLFWQYASTSVFSREVFFKYMDLNSSLNVAIKDLTKKVDVLNKLAYENNKIFKEKKGFFRKIRKGISSLGKCLYENGIVYTFIRIFMGREKANAYKKKHNKR